MRFSADDADDEPTSASEILPTGSSTSGAVVPSSSSRISAVGAPTSASEILRTGSSTSVGVEASSVSRPSGVSARRSVMGPEERKLLKQSAVDKQEKLMNAINDATSAYETKLEEIANANGYKVDRIKQLALYSPPIKSRRKVSDWNIMVYFKGRELNDGQWRFSLHVRLFFF